MGLDRNSPTPLYLQLKALLAAQIAEAGNEPGSRLPSERQLCQQYGVSRTTVRQALSELDREGLIRTVPGRATFGATPQADLSVKVSLGGFTSDVRRQGLVPSSILLDARLISTPAPELVRVMGLGPHDDVAMVKRIRLINNARVALHTVYLNHRLCPQVLHHNLGHDSLFAILREKYNLKLARAEQQVYAALANEREMELLNLAHPAAVLRAERTTFLDSGEVIEFSLSSYCGGWYRLTMALEAID